MKNKQSKKIILAIETSCDETAAAVLEVSLASPSAFAKTQIKTIFPTVKTLSSVINSQTKLHSKMGGVVPEAAARAHLKNILPVVSKTIHNSQLTINDIDYLAVTQGPGLIPSLIVGVEFAKALAMATKKPIIPVNHMLGHLYSPFQSISESSNQQTSSLFPSIALIVSGGHTMIVLMSDAYNYKVIGQTVDDAAGEAFDKVSKMLKLPYPGGPVVAKMADEGKANYALPRPMINAKNYDFSFSGLKTAVLYKIKDLGLKISARGGSASGGKDKQTLVDLCNAFQDAVVDVLVTKTLRAAKEFKAKSITLSGGVSANRALRNALANIAEKNNLKFLPSPLSLSGDNAEMIGLAAAFMLTKGLKPKSFKTIKADSNLEL